MEQNSIFEGVFTIHGDMALVKLLMDLLILTCCESYNYTFIDIKPQVETITYHIMPILFHPKPFLQACSVLSHLKRSTTWSCVGRGLHTGETTSTITSSPASSTLAKASTIPPSPGKRHGHSVESAAWISSQLSLSQSSGW